MFDKGPERLVREIQRLGCVEFASDDLARFIEENHSRPLSYLRGRKNGQGSVPGKVRALLICLRRLGLVKRRVVNGRIIWSLVEASH